MSSTVVEVQTASTKQRTHSSIGGRATCIVELWLCCEGVLYCYVTAKEHRRSYERVHVCLYVRVTLTLQHVSLVTLEGMLIMPFLVVPAAVEAASATLAQCPA